MNRAPCAVFLEEDPFSWYILLFDGIFILGLIINVYIIYCLIYRSPKSMSVYKWYLFYHQIVTLITDAAYNFVAKPVVFLPFVGGYPMSIFRGWVPTHWMTVYCAGWTLFSIATIVHLFWFRYLAVRRLDKPPFHYWIRITFLYIFTAGVACANYACQPDTENIVEKNSKEYTCVGDYLFKIDGFILYDWKAVAPFVIPYIFSYIGFCSLEMLYLIVFSMRQTYVANMSPQLAKLNRKFLIQLMVQAGTPFVIVTVPYLAYFISVVTEALSLGQGFGHILVAANGSFSTTSAVILMVMNKSYRPTLLQKKMETTFVAPVSTLSTNLTRVA